MSALIRCECGSTRFVRMYSVRGKWEEWVTSNASGGVDVCESTTDNLEQGAEPRFMKCLECGRNARNPDHQ